METDINLKKKNSSNIRRNEAFDMGCLKQKISWYVLCR